MMKTYGEAWHLTPIDDDYPACERTHAALTIYSDILDPEAITALLKTSPTHCQKAGEIRTNSLGRTRTIRTGGWFLSSEEQVPSRDLRRHLDWLLSRLESAGPGLRTLQGSGDVTMTVVCIWWSAQGGGGPTLWPEQMRLLASLGLECTFDISFFGDDESDEEPDAGQGESLGDR